MSIQDDIQDIRRKVEDEQKSSLRIALFGQPGSGKSSLINRLIGEPVAKTGVSTDVTVEANFYEHGELLLVDLPGYGTSKFPANEWINTYNPKEFDLFLCVFSGKFHDADTNFFNELQESGRVCLFVRNMHDQLWDPEKALEQIEEEIEKDVHLHVGTKVPVYFTSCRTNQGLDLLQDGIQSALEPAQSEKYARNAKAYSMKHLQRKKEESQKLVYRYAAVAAANGLNPLPGVDISVDIGIMLKLFNELRESYGIKDQQILNLGPALVPIANRVIEYATKEGVILILKKYATKVAVKSTAKYVPFVGQAIAASAAFAMTMGAGMSYLNDVHSLAEGILEKELNKNKAGV